MQIFLYLLCPFLIPCDPKQILRGAQKEKNNDTSEMSIIKIKSTENFKLRLPQTPLNRLYLFYSSPTVKHLTHFVSEINM